MEGEGLNPWLQGLYAPVTVERSVEELEVTGRVPDGLSGRYLRNGPNPVAPPEPATYHWFTGDGMVHGVRLRHGRAQWYRNRWVRSASVARALGEDPRPGPVHAGMDFAPNTNVIGHGGRTLAIVEAGARPYELTYDLETVGPWDFDGTLEGGYSAHPKRDPKTGELHAVSYFWGWGSQVRYSVQDRTGRVVRSLDVPTTGATSVHDMSITERYGIVLDLPVVFNPQVAGSGAAFPYRWDPGYPSRVGLVARQEPFGSVEWFDVEPCYVFHILNSYDDGDAVVVDVVRHPQMFATALLGPGEGPPSLDRWTLRPGQGAVHEERLDDRGQEFPRMDERRLGGRHRFAYTVSSTGDPAGEGFGGALLRHDLGRAMTEVRRFEGGQVAGEPVFVPREPTGEEEDGWVLSLVYSPQRRASDLVVLNASDFCGPPQAVVHLPARVPNGFHGNWVPDDLVSPPKI